VQSVLLTVTANPDGVVRAAGFNGSIVECVGESWREISAGTNEHIFCLRGLSSTEWALCGINGLFRATRAGAWRGHDVGSEHLTCLVEADGFTVVGFNGALFQQNEMSWSPITITSQHLWSICAAGPQCLVAVGARGTVLVRDGGAWSVVACPVEDDLLSVSGHDGFVVAVGKHGAVVLGERVQ
jgi:hypothetical protein